MKLSKRLKTIADMIPENSHVLDIGCDHALLDIYLTLEKGCRCVASDVNNHALQSARDNVDKYEVQKEVEIVCAPGLNGVEVTEESYVVIAGMGTMTILDILSSPQTSKIQHLILQSNRELETLRKEVTRLGFRICEEYALEEKGIFYVVILWERGSATYQEMEYRYGPYLLKHDLDYLKQMLRREKELFVRLPENHSKKRSEQKKTIAFLEKRIASFSK